MRILLGVTGSISAYKACDIISVLKKSSVDITVVMTKSAEKFINKNTFEALTNNTCYTDIFLDDKDGDIMHIKLAKEFDLILVAPTTYNFIGKIANGLADDMLSCIISATKKPVFFALAMNTFMYENHILQDNIDKLKKYGYEFIEPKNGILACGDQGIGKLEDVNVICECVLNKNKLLNGKNILITAGATREYIDKIRYITNLSSGKMGYQLAKQAKLLGANVTLIMTKNQRYSIEGINYIEVETSSDMEKEVFLHKDKQDMIIMASAVSDYRPKNYTDSKIKKTDDNIFVELERTTDILYKLGQNKKFLLIGFAAESENLIENGHEKLLKKSLDYVIINNIKAMSMDNTEVILMESLDNTQTFKGSKRQVAKNILITIGEKNEKH